MEQSGFHSSLAFLSVAQETVVVRREWPECDGDMGNRLINCRPYRRRKQTVWARAFPAVENTGRSSGRARRGSNHQGTNSIFRLPGTRSGLINRPVKPLTLLNSIGTFQRPAE